MSAEVTVLSLALFRNCIAVAHLQNILVFRKTSNIGNYSEWTFSTCTPDMHG